ncbi:MAG TPA: hypothetical protein VNO75_05410 [Gemmatimonadaceae bacterium]|nr:hypothetical protein [Gemmatimonadaceae bacterium]
MGSKSGRTGIASVALILATACGESAVDPIIDLPTGHVPPSPAMQVRGTGTVGERFTAEVWVHGNFAYTSTWGFRSAPGNAVKIWNVAGGGAPVLVDSVIVANASTLGDIQVSDDGSLLVVATEGGPGSIVLYDLADPVKPTLITRYATARTSPGVHTAEVQRVNGRLYAFLSIDPPARLVIVDITDPAEPVEVFTAPMGDPFLHDVFVRDGILFTALWDAGMSIWDIGGAGNGSVSNPRFISNIRTRGGQAHNIWWYHSPGGEKRYAFIGEEGPGSVGSSASGDIHVIDVSNLAAPREVGFYRVSGAGAHNFSMDEARGILYAAFYNGGVRALDVRGNLSSCSPAERSVVAGCDLRVMRREVANGLQGGGPVFVWGVQFLNGRVYASDMLNGLAVLDPFIPSN